MSYIQRLSLDMEYADLHKLTMLPISASLLRHVLEEANALRDAIGLPNVFHERNIARTAHEVVHQAQQLEAQLLKQYGKEKTKL